MPDFAVALGKWVIAWYWCRHYSDIFGACGAKGWQVSILRLPTWGSARRYARNFRAHYRRAPPPECEWIGCGEVVEEEGTYCERHRRIVEIGQ